MSRKKQFVFSIGSNYFLEIAKLRAFRILWKRNRENPYIFAQTEFNNKTEEFAYNNLLRSTTEGMSAIFVVAMDYSSILTIILLKGTTSLIELQEINKFY